MRRARQLMLHTSAMTATTLLMRTIAMVFQVYVAGKIGAAGIGLFQLVLSVYTLATTVAQSGIRLAATRLVAEQVGRRDEPAIRRAVRCAVGYSASSSPCVCWPLRCRSSPVPPPWAVILLRCISRSKCRWYSLPNSWCALAVPFWR